jgi:hypothetical protein
MSLIIYLLNKLIRLECILHISNPSEDHKSREENNRVNSYVYILPYTVICQ